MKEIKSNGCAEYQSISRRGLVGSLAEAATGWIPQVTYTEDAQPHASIRTPGTTRDIIVTVFLRGGADGFALVAPWKDNNYATYRKNTAVGTPTSTDPLKKAIDLDGFFGLTPAMSPLAPIYNNKFLLFAHQTGQTDSTRSHFDAQHYMEVGKVDKQLWSGWMGRHIKSVSELKAGAVIRTVSMGGQLPLILEGSPKTAVITDLVNYGLNGDSSTVSKRLDFLLNAYSTADPALKDASVNARKTLEVLQKVNYPAYKPAATYNPPVVSTLANGSKVTTEAPWWTTEFGEAMKASAALIKSDVGVESIHIDFGGWDTHDNEWLFEGRDQQGNVNFGGTFWQVRALAANLAAFFNDIDSVKLSNSQTMMSRVTVVVMTEFGRTVNENGSNGTDHGQGSVMMFMGRGVNGKRVDRDWKMLGNGGIDSFEGLAVTVDYRIYLGELLEKRLRNGNQLATVFPGFKMPVTGWRGAFLTT